MILFTTTVVLEASRVASYLRSIAKSNIKLLLSQETENEFQMLGFQYME